LFEHFQRIKDWLALLTLLSRYTCARCTSARFGQEWVTTDPDDNKFLECADAARADYLITGNQKHFPKFWKKTKVIMSREFIDLVAPHLIP
jgi:predicted nucleic acid-binding protein